MKEEIAQFASFLHRRFGTRSTPKHYVNDVQLFFAHIGPKAVTFITARDIDSFVEAQVNRNLKATTINRRLAALHSFFEFLADQNPDDALPNPVIWRRHKRKQAQPVPRDVPDDQVEALFAEIDNVRDKAIFGLMVGAGLRVGEVVRLRLTDLERPHSPEQLARLRVWGKGEKERIVWLTPHWYRLVTQWLNQRPATDNDFVFLNRSKQPLSVRGIQERLQTYSQRAGVYLTPHQLRHTFSRRLADQRMPVESISKLLGHAQIETTQRYTASADPDLRDEFRQAMAGVAQATISATPSLLPISIPPPQPETADLADLERILRRFDPFPDWLGSLLRAHLTQRWHKWQPHMAAQHAARLTRRLAVTWTWLLERRSLSRLAALRRSDVEAFLNARAAAGLTANTRCHDLSTLRAFLFFAQEQGVAVSASVFRIPYPERPEPLPRHLSSEAYQRLVNTVLHRTEADTPQNRLDRAWFLMLAHTGVRLSELLNLRLSDLDLASGRIRIRSSKNGHGRLVYTTAELTRALLAYLPVRPHLPDDHLWLETDKRLHDRLVRSRLRRWGQAAGIDVSPHVLRHTVATLLINRGMPVETLRRLLGHRSPNVTQQYARLSDSVVQRQFQAAIEGIEGIAAAEWPVLSSIDKVQAAYKLT